MDNDHTGVLGPTSSSVCLDSTALDTMGSRLFQTPFRPGGGTCGETDPLVVKCMQPGRCKFRKNKMMGGVWADMKDIEIRTE